MNVVLTNIIELSTLALEHANESTLKNIYLQKVIL